MLQSTIFSAKKEAGHVYCDLRLSVGATSPIIVDKTGWDGFTRPAPHAIYDAVTHARAIEMAEAWVDDASYGTATFFEGKRGNLVSLSSKGVKSLEDGEYIKNVVSAHVGEQVDRFTVREDQVTLSPNGCKVIEYAAMYAAAYHGATLMAKGEMGCPDEMPLLWLLALTGGEKTAHFNEADIARDNVAWAVAEVAMGGNLVTSEMYGRYSTVEMESHGYIITVEIYDEEVYNLDIVSKGVCFNPPSEVEMPF